MTELQREIYRFMLQEQLSGRPTPTRQALADAVGISKTRAVRELFRLEALGLLRHVGWHEIEVFWPEGKNVIEPPYRVLWRMIGDELVYAPEDVLRADAGLGQDARRE